MTEIDDNDRRVEERLRRYQIAGPSPTLRARCLTPPVEPPAWTWLAAAAALLACTMATHLANASARARVGVWPSPDATDLAVRELTDRLAGDLDVGELAWRVVDEDRARRESEARTSRFDSTDGASEGEAR